MLLLQLWQCNKCFTSDFYIKMCPHWIVIFHVILLTITSENVFAKSKKRRLFSVWFHPQTFLLRDLTSLSSYESQKKSITHLWKVSLFLTKGLLPNMVPKMFLWNGQTWVCPQKRMLSKPCTLLIIMIFHHFR